MEQCWNCGSRPFVSRIRTPIFQRFWIRSRIPVQIRLNLSSHPPPPQKKRFIFISAPSERKNNVLRKILCVIFHKFLFADHNKHGFYSNLQAQGRIRPKRSRSDRIRNTAKEKQWIRQCPQYKQMCRHPWLIATLFTKKIWMSIRRVAFFKDLFILTKIFHRHIGWYR